MTAEELYRNLTEENKQKIQLLIDYLLSRQN